jgi:hypothetical protein
VATDTRGRVRSEKGLDGEGLEREGAKEIYFVSA